MAGKASCDSIPESFSSIAEAAEFWDEHDLGDFEAQTQEVTLEIDLKRRTFLAALEPGLALKVTKYAHNLGVSTETLVNLWLSERLSVATAGK